MCVGGVGGVVRERLRGHFRKLSSIETDRETGRERERERWRQRREREREREIERERMGWGGGVVTRPRRIFQV